MLTTHTDQRVLGYLGRALSLELSAVQLYTTQSRLLAIWGLTEESSRFKKEAQEELGHAERIIGRMLALSVSPNASQLRPTPVANNLQALLEYNLAFENELVALYSQATQHCSQIGDQDNRLFFETLLNEEKSHADELTQWLKQLEQPGMNQRARTR